MSFAAEADSIETAWPEGADIPADALIAGEL
jgi:hypothetical protein